MSPENAIDTVVLEGILLPVRWGPNGEVSHVSLMTFDEAEYRIDTSAASTIDVKRFLRRHVRVFGQARDGHLVAVTSIETPE